MARRAIRIAEGLALVATLAQTQMARAAADLPTSWRTTGQDLPAWTWLAYPPIHVLAFGAHYCFFIMPLLILLAIVVPIVRGKKAPPLPRRR